uniref:ARAD1D08272p n=1 Tax=Blastobotrys adeninivorans TaxID=409370 RepID=A0A060T8M2_BLAAD
MIDECNEIESQSIPIYIQYYLIHLVLFFFFFVLFLFLFFLLSTFAPSIYRHIFSSESDVRHQNLSFMDPAVEAAAGLSAGALTTIVVHPLDMARVRLQVDKGVTTLSQVLKQAIRSREPVKELYRGLGPNLAGNTTAWGCYFMIYGTLVDRWATPGNASHYMYSAFTAGALTGFMTNPIWVIKTRMLATTRSDPNALTSMYQGFKLIYTNEGLRGFWRGYTPGLFGVVQASVQFTLYQKFKDYLNAKHRAQSIEPQLASQISALEYICISAISKSMATLSLYPYQVVRTRLQYAAHAYGSPTDVVKRVIKEEGIAGFYRGLGTNLLRVVPATCVTFVVYEKVKAGLQNARNDKSVTL